MKNCIHIPRIPTLLIFLFSLCASYSCSDEDLFLDAVIIEEEPIESTPTPPEEGSQGGTTDPVVGDVLKINQNPCKYTLDDLSANETLSIDCQVDLGGRTVNLPANVSLEFNGGEIVNGTLNFSGGTIDGELLNVGLTITGNAKLSQPEFKFYPERWDMIEGKTNDAIALNNKHYLQKAIDLSKKLQADTFAIGALNAYFSIAGEWVNEEGYNRLGINLPSDFHFKMSNNTYIRVQPNNWPKGLLLGVYKKQNVLITGGNLVGDRYEHDYSPINDEVGIARNTHEWPGLLVVAGSKDITVDGVYMTDSTGDAFIPGAAGGFRFDPNNPYNQNIIARNCTFNASRRNNVSITDGANIIIENCTITNAGNGENIYANNGDKIYSSAGVAPKVGIDIEPFRGYNPDGSTKDYEKVDGVIIRGCTFTNNNVASIIDYSGKDVVMENNFSDHVFTASYSTGAQFLNNVFEASEKNRAAPAISTGNWIISVNGVDTQFSENNIVSGNTIKGFRVGVIAYGSNGRVFNNYIEDFEYGIQVKNASGYIFENNIMETSQTNAIGVSISNISAKNLLFKNQTITVPRKPFELFNVNTAIDAKTSFIKFTDSNFTSRQGYDSFIKNTPNVEVSNTVLNNTGFTLENAVNFTETSNTYN
jgi:hypothetical protein